MALITRTLLIGLLLASACREGEEPGAEESSSRADGAEGGAATAPPADATPPDAAPGPSYPATSDGLRQLIGDLLEAAAEDDRARAYELADSLRISDPDAYFAGVFGAQLGAELASDYGATAARLRELVPLLRELAGEGRRELRVRSFETASDGAVGYQARALERMVEPTPLYSVRLAKRGNDRGFHLFSFIHDGESFRWVGKLQAVAPAGETLEPPEEAEIPLDAGAVDLLELPGSADVRGGE